MKPFIINLILLPLYIVAFVFTVLLMAITFPALIIGIAFYMLSEKDDTEATLLLAEVICFPVEQVIKLKKLIITKLSP